MNDASFGAIVRSLELRNIDNMAAHAGSGDEASVPIILERPAMYVRALLFLPSPDSTCRPGTIKGAI